MLSVTYGVHESERGRGASLSYTHREKAHTRASARYWASAFVKSRWAAGEGESGSGPWGRSGPSGQIGKGRVFFSFLFFKAIFKSFSTRI